MWNVDLGICQKVTKILISSRSFSNRKGLSKDHHHVLPELFLFRGKDVIGDIIERIGDLVGSRKGFTDGFNRVQVGGRVRGLMMHCRVIWTIA